MESLLDNHPDKAQVELWAAAKPLGSKYGEVVTMKQEWNIPDVFEN
jgi:hypothetical protein